MSGIQTAMAESIKSFKDLANPERCRERARFFNFPETPEMIAAFADQPLEIGNGNAAWVGLRFRRLNRDFPFVKLTTSQFIQDESELAAAIAKASAVYSQFNPRGVSWDSAPGREFSRAFQIWSQTWWAPTDQLNLRAEPYLGQVSWPSQFDNYRDYQHEYELFLAENPVMKTFLQCESAKDMHAIAKAGQLMSISDREGWGGVIAGKTESLYGRESLYVFELFLAKRLRGKGGAKLWQSEFFRHLLPRFNLIYGNIDFSNESSRRTAKALGREILESEYFFPVN